MALVDLTLFKQILSFMPSSVSNASFYSLVFKINVSAREKQGKQEKLKRELLKILTWYDLSRIGPYERARPQLSEYVWDMTVYMI